jgi:hypothetical protein
MRQQIDELFGKEMSRKEFLQHIGSGLLILFGISGLLKALTQQQPKTQPHGLSYGASAYGGAKR